LEIVEVASLLHDIQDWKYSGSETAGAATIQVWKCYSFAQSVAACLTCISVLVSPDGQAFLQEHSYPQDKQKAVLAVIQGIGFKVSICLYANLLHTAFEANALPPHQRDQATTSSCRSLEGAASARVAERIT